MIFNNSGLATRNGRRLVASVVVLGLPLLASVDGRADDQFALKSDAYVVSLNGQIAFARHEGDQVIFTNEHGHEMIAKPDERGVFNTPWGGPKVLPDGTLVWRDSEWYPMTGNYINKQNGRIASLKVSAPEMTFEFVNENGYDLRAKLGAGGQFETMWGGPKLRSDRALVWRDSIWYPLAGKYANKHNPGTTWVRFEGHDTAFINENGHAIKSTVKNDGSFDCPQWGGRASFTTRRTIEWPGPNVWTSENALKVTLAFSRFICEGTTELGGFVDNKIVPGADEIYIMVAGKKTNGEEIVRRIPDEHWDMIPPRQKNNLQGKPLQFPGQHAPPETLLWNGMLAVNECTELTFFVLEEDRQEDPKGNPLDLAREAARNTDPHDPATIGTNHNIIGLLDDRLWRHGKGHDSDDCPGVIAVRLKNNGGELEVTWATRERARDKGDENGARHFELTGDGSKYQLYLKAQGQ